jgi:Na+/melibiose symporter-like transporter
VLVPVLLIVPFWLGTRYAITRASHRLTREELDRRRAAAHRSSPDVEPADLPLATPVPQIPA